jgi:hypothetical protein
VVPDLQPGADLEARVREALLEARRTRPGPTRMPSPAC